MRLALGARLGAALATLLLMAPAAWAIPTLEFEATPLDGDLVAYDFSVHGNDDKDLSFFAAITFMTTDGTPFVQQLFNMAIPVDKDSFASGVDGVGDYMQLADSWYYDEDFSVPNPIPDEPGSSGFFGLDVGSDKVKVSLGTAGGAGFRVANLIHLVVPEGVGIMWDTPGFDMSSGYSISREGQNFPTSGTTIPEPATAATMGLGLAGIAFAGRRR